MKVAFLGLGRMGAAMAEALAHAGHELRGYDPVAPAPAGVRRAGTIAEAATGAEAAILMLPDASATTRAVAELAAVLKKGALVIDCSTIGVAAARDLAAAVTATGLQWVEAPVSGGTAAARAGTLTFHVGGSEEAHAAAEPLLLVMGRKTVHCGGPGSGQAVRLCNNMVLGATMLATCEAFVLADRLGIPGETLFEVLSDGSGQSWALSRYCPVPGVGPQTPADDDYRPGYPAEHMLDDLSLAQGAAALGGTSLPLAAAAQALFDAFVAEGGRGRDFSAVIQHLAARGTGPAAD